jgi:hypothetical protein
MAVGPEGKGGKGGAWRPQGCIVGKDALDRLAEHAGDPEGERQARVVLAGFECVDGLARHRQLFGERALRPAARLAQFAQAVVHR